MEYLYCNAGEQRCKIAAPGVNGHCTEHVEDQYALAFPEDRAEHAASKSVCFDIIDLILFGVENENSLYFKIKDGLIPSVILVVYTWTSKWLNCVRPHIHLF